jgi:hypothetical protein
MMIAQVKILDATARLVEAKVPKSLKYGKDSAFY